MNYFTGVGSRKTPPFIQDIMSILSGFLTSRKFILRSGGADGADLAFERGVSKHNGEKEIWVPWIGFNNSTSLLLPSPESFDIAATIHPAWNKLKDSHKKLHARNVHQVLGKDLKTPSKFLICYTEDGLPSGGTATAIRLAYEREIPVYNLHNGLDKNKLADLILDINHGKFE
jgi:hypothetical protein